MIKGILKTFYYLVIIAITIIALFLILSVFPTKSGYGSFVVLSGSMEPKIHTGSVVAVKSQREYQVGDVITFGESTRIKKPTTHRIVEIKENSTGGKSYVTKGDANNALDRELVKEDEVLGRVVVSIPYIGYAIAEAQKPVGFILIIIVPAVIIIYDELQKVKKEILKKVDYKKRSKKRKESKGKNIDQIEEHFNNKGDDKIPKKDSDKVSENKEKNDEEKKEV